MTIYTQVFGGGVIQPAQASYADLTLTSVLQLEWPLETAPNTSLVTQVIDIASATAGSGIQLPTALSGSPGYAFIVVNRAANAVIVNDNMGATIVSVAPGAVFFVYLRDNSTQAGSWGSFQYGAATSAPSAAALAGSGLKAVGSQLAQDIPVTALNTNYSPGSADLASLLNWTGGSGVFTLPIAGSVGTDWYVQVRNSGNSTLAVTPTSPSLINGSASLSFNPGDSAFVVSDGSNYYTIGFGNAQTNLFQFLVIDLTGLSGTYTLSGAAQNKIAYRFTGVKTGNLQIVVPSTVQQYWVDNETDNTYTLSVGTSGQASPPTVVYGGRTILYCDGTNVVNAVTGGIAIPVAISQGGTGATTAGGALANLGGTSVGIAVFTAAAASNAQATLGVPSTADALALAMSVS
jgi:hypothetical protein